MTDLIEHLEIGNDIKLRLDIIIAHLKHYINQFKRGNRSKELEKIIEDLEERVNELTQRKEKVKKIHVILSL